MVNENELLYLVISIIMVLIVTYAIAKSSPRRRDSQK